MRRRLTVCAAAWRTTCATGCTSATVDARAAHAASAIGVIAVATARQEATKRFVGCSSHQRSEVAVMFGWPRLPHACSATTSAGAERVRAGRQQLSGQVCTFERVSGGAR